MVKPKATCTIEGCTEPHRCKGFCALHYEHFLATDPSRPRCKVDGCETAARRGGFCNMHYQRDRNNGSALIVQTIRNDDAARMESYIKRLDNGCWEWTGKFTRSGYAKTSGRSQRAARLVWMVYNGPIPEGLTLDHICHNEAFARGECAGGVTCLHRRCVNPAHLMLSPPGENMLRGGSPSAVNARKERCNDGHEYTEENTNIITRKDGSTYRECRACRRRRSREALDRKRPDRKRRPWRRIQDAS